VGSNVSGSDFDGDLVMEREEKMSDFVPISLKYDATSLEYLKRLDLTLEGYKKDYLGGSVPKRSINLKDLRGHDIILMLTSFFLWLLFLFFFSIVFCAVILVRI